MFGPVTMAMRIVLAIELCVVRHKLFFDKTLIQHRMAPILNHEPERIV